MNAPEANSADSDQLLLDDLKAHQVEQEREPNNHLPPYHCGLIHAQLGDHSSAVRSYLTALERNPEFSQGYFNLAIAYSKQGLYSEAEEAYLQAGAASDSDAEPWANLGALREYLGREEDALEAYRKAVDLDPNEREVRRLIGMIYFNRGDHQQAAKIFEEAVAHDPNNEEAWNNLGLIAFRQDKLDEAAKHYQRSVEIDPDYAQAWNNLGNLYLKQGNEAGAVGAYRRALSGDSQDSTIWFNLGEFFFTRDHPEAEKCLSRVVELDKSDMEAWEMLRQWYKRHPNYPSWISVLKVLLANNPDDISLMREMSFVHEKTGDHAEAIRLLKDVIVKEPNDQESRLMMAGLAMKQGKPLDAYEQMNRLDTNEDDALDMWQYLGQRLVYHGDFEQAENSFMKVIAHRPWQLDAWNFLGELASRREEWELAFERNSRAEEINRNDREVWLPLANRFVENGDHGKACECLDKIAGALSYLDGDWERFYPIYEKAGRSEDFLGMLETQIWDNGLPNNMWLPLAGLFARSGLGERAQVCLGRLEGGLENHPESEAILESILLGQMPAALETPPEDREKDTEKNTGEASQQPPAVPSGVEVGMLPPTMQAPELPASEQSEVESQLETHLRSLQLDPKDFRPWFNAGNALFRLQRLEEAVRHFRSAIELNPGESKAWYNLGCTQEAMGDAAGACESFEHAVALEPGFAQAWNWLGVLRYEMGDQDSSRQAYVRALAYDRSSAKTWHNLGVLYHHQSEGEKSAYCFQESRKHGGV